MSWSVFITTFWTLISVIQASSLHHYHKRGQLPISVSSVRELGDVHSETTYVARDLGFAGQIGNYVLLSYGDTLYSDATYNATFRGMTSDSMALATHDPLKVRDISLNRDGYPQQFCPIMGIYNETAAEYALGITNVVETYPDQGRPAPQIAGKLTGDSSVQVFCTFSSTIGPGVSAISSELGLPPSMCLARTPPILRSSA